MIATLIVLAKAPVPGRVKTRLTPALTAQQAATVAAAALADTLDAVAEAPSPHKTLAFDGDAAPWLRPGWTHCTQPGGGLDRRIVAAFDSAARRPALLVGMDTPQLTPALLGEFDPARYDACVGPSEDGGYWAIGFADPRLAARAVTGIAMSTDHTCSDQLHRLAAIGLRVQLLDRLRDVDTIDDAFAVAELAPTTRFAAAFGDLYAGVR